ncbi:MAG: carbohydrate ABC transporter permease [Oscillospiraceae bacterium]
MNTIKKFKKVKISRVAVYVLITLLVTFTALPLIYVINTAFKPIHELYIWPPQFFVHEPTMQNFSDLLTALSSSTVPFTRYIFNSIFTTLATVFLTVVVSAMGAYGLAKHKPRGSGAIMAIVLAALMFSPHVTQIPNYLIVKQMGLLNTYAALIVPKIAVAYNFFLMERFAVQIPNALLEASRIDGASEFRIFWKIAMPILRPAWATLIVFSFVANWNDYFSALVYIDSQAMKVLPLALQTISGTAVIDTARAGASAAVSLIMILPTILIYILMQKQIMKTMAHSGIK